MAKRAEIIGMKELEKAMKRLGQVPQRVATKAARAGATIALRSARKKARVLTGEMKRGIIMKGERRSVIGKKVYDIMMDPAKNDIFVRLTADGKRFYYPASMEYGFLTADGRKVPGTYFLRDSVADNAGAIEQKVVSVAGKEIDKALKG